MADLINKKAIRRQWKYYLKNEEFADYLAFYRGIKNIAYSMALQMIDFLFIDEVYCVFLELLELGNNVDIMTSTKSPETRRLCKERIDYLLQNKADNWYL